MDYRMLGDILPTVEVRLQAGEAMYTQSGGMAWMSDGFTLNSNAKEGPTKGLGGMFSGESSSMVAYMASRPDSAIALVSTMSRRMLAIDTAKTGLICQKRVFLCVQTTAEINTVLTKKFTAGFFGGEGSILQQIQGGGMASPEMDGDVVERVLASEKMIEMDTGNVFISEPSVSYEIETMKGVENTPFGSGGLLLAKLTGPGKAYMQIVNTVEFTGRIAQGLPTSK